MAVEGNGGGWFELFAIESRKYSDNIVRACRGLNDTGAGELLVQTSYTIDGCSTSDLLLP